MYMPSQGGAAGQYARPAGAEGATHFPVIAPRPAPPAPYAYYASTELHSPAPVSPAYGFIQHRFGTPTSPAPSNGHRGQYSVTNHKFSFANGQTSNARGGHLKQAPQATSGPARLPSTPLTPATPQAPRDCSRWLKSTVAHELANNNVGLNGGFERHLHPPSTTATPSLTSHSSSDVAEGHRRGFDEDANGQQPFHTFLSAAPMQDGSWSSVTNAGRPVGCTYSEGATPRLESFSINMHLAPNSHEQWCSATEASPPTAVAGFHTDRVVPHELEPADDEELYDAESDDESGWRQRDYHWSMQPRQNLDIIMAVAADRDPHWPYTGFLPPDMLTYYRPKFTASPLMDQTTARVFCHFITSTGPSLSAFERCLVDPYTLIEGKAVPTAEQGLWTYTLPILALSDLGLLQSMLALSSLQVARLQQAPLTAPMKHYHYALRKVAKAVAIPTRRTHNATIAATLILAHFEAITAEHKKWTSHLAGAAQLLMEIDFDDVVRRSRAEQRARDVSAQSAGGWYLPTPTHSQPSVDSLHIPSLRDEEVASMIMGRRVQYGQRRSRIEDDTTASSGRPPLTAKDQSEYRTRQDLFWWFCKMDMIQSLVRGGALL